jgi:prepilin-type N-terminal cleavage/methylation domain-containing protein
MISATGNSRPKAAKAFTFIELLIVIALVGIVTAISAPQFRSTFDRLRLEGFAKEIYYLAEYLQESAISQNKNFCLDIDARFGKFQAQREGDEEGEFKTFSGRFGRVYAAPEGIMVAVEPADTERFYFYPDASTASVSIKFSDDSGRGISLKINGGNSELGLK